MVSDRFVYIIIKRKLHGGLKMKIIFFCVKNNIKYHSEGKIYIFVLPCNDFYVQKNSLKCYCKRCTQIRDGAAVLTRSSVQRQHLLHSCFKTPGVGLGGVQTCDLPLSSLVLYQLS